DRTTGVISGTPSAAGNFAIAITVSDSALNNSIDRFGLNVNMPPAPAVNISGLPATTGPAQQFPIDISLGSTYPAPITGTAVLTISPDNGPVDRTVQFASGGTTANFSFPVGNTSIDSTPLAIQTGTVAGTITISLRLQAGGVDITPTLAPA